MHINGCQVIIFKTYDIVFFCLKDFFRFTNSVDSDAAFHLGLTVCNT